MPALFHESLYDRARFHPSYWAASTPEIKFPTLQHDLDCDVAIIGGGLNGLSAALHLVRDHQLSATVLEAGQIGWGASGRNAGFNTMPCSKLAPEVIFRNWGETDATAFFQSQREGVELVYALAHEEQFDVQPCGDGVFTVAHKRSAFQELETEHNWLRRAGIPSRLLSQDAFRESGHDGSEQFGALHLQLGGGINPLAFTNGLAAAAQRRGASIFAQSPVQQWHKQGSHHELVTPQGKVRARYLVIATNAYRDVLDMPVLDRRVLPAISNILVTEPLSENRWRGSAWHSTSPISDTRQLLNYYRHLADGRLLFGARGSTTGHPKTDAAMQAALLAAIQRKFPELGPVKAEFFWRGLVALTRKMIPTFGHLPDDASVFFNLGCFGNGINTMPWLGRSIARAIAGVTPTGAENSSVYRALPARLPPSRFLQRGSLQLAYLHYALRDRFF